MEGESAWLEEHKAKWVGGLERVYDEIIQDVRQEMDRRLVAHSDEIKKGDERHAILARRWQEEIMKNAYLTEENSRLKRHLEKLDPKGTNPVPQPNRSVPGTEANMNQTGGSISSDEYYKLAKQFDDLQRSHRETLQRLKYVEKKNVAVMQKNKDMKESVRAWQKYSERHQAKVERAKSESKFGMVQETTEMDNGHIAFDVPSSPPTALVVTPRSFGALDPSSPGLFLAFERGHSPQEPEPDAALYSPNAARRDGMHRLSTTERTNISGQVGASISDVAEGRQAVDDDMKNTANMKQRQDPDNTITSSQTTQDEPAAFEGLFDSHQVATTDDDDEPQFVSERSLKRKRMDPPAVSGHSRHSAGASLGSRRIKDEPLSSPHEEMPIYHLHRKETMDLDEVGPQILMTPHRRRPGMRDPAAFASLRHHRSTSVPMIKEERIESKESMAGHRTGIPPERLESLLTTDGEARAHSEPSDSTQPRVRPLQPLDPNVRSIRQAETKNSIKRLKKSEQRSLDQYRMLTEAGDVPPSIERRSRLPPTAARARFNERIRAVKDDSTPSRPPITNKQKTEQLATPPVSATKTMRSGRVTESSEGALHDALFTSDAKTSAMPRDPPIWPAPRRTRHSESKPRQALRTRPINELKLSDFKPNPRHGQGYSYAYAETVRKASERACLPGCTSEDCCGSKFRALAAAQPPLSLTEEEKLLEEFLGDAYESMLFSQVQPEEREELVLQARTRKFANEHGKHRQAFERHRTPPGFWRMDFPTTQEEQEDRRKADEMQSDMVKLRFAEAMRKNGKWIFADE